LRGKRARPAAVVLGSLLIGAGPGRAQQASLPPVLAEIDRHVREEFWDPKMKGADWDGAVKRAASELSRARDAAERDAAYDRLLAVLKDSHTFRIPPGRLPERGWGTAGVRIGREGEGFAVKGVMPGYAGEHAGMKIGDRVLSVEGRSYGRDNVNFRDLYLVFEGRVGREVEVVWQPAGGPVRTSRLALKLEEPADALVWKSARIIHHNGRAYGYARLWGMRAESVLAIVDLLLDRTESARAKPGLAGWDAIEGFLLDVRGSSGGYDPNILATFLRGGWSSGDYYEIGRDGRRRLVPPVYQKLPVALLVNSGTASQGELLAMRFRAHEIGPVVGEETAGMASGGAASDTLSDGSALWISRRAIEDRDGHSYESRGFVPDVLVADRPGGEGREDAIVEAGLKALSGLR
jgi:C-terminal processing protease CtpA/Prc